MSGTVDTHLHLWDLGTGDYGWNTPALGPVHADFGPEDAAAALASAGVDRAVLVQAADTVGDSERMLAVADGHPWVAGVVAWVPLEEPDRAAALLDRWAATGRVVGVRQLVHDHPDPTLLDDARVRATVDLLVERGLPLDVPDAWPALWPAVLRLVRDRPDLTVVLDHLGKPSLGTDALGRSAGDARDRWEADLRRLAAHPSVVAKVSGLGPTLAPGTAPSTTTLGPLVDVALDAFGPDRLMLGGDWPVSLAVAPYAATLATLGACLASLGPDEQDAVRHGTATRVYALAPSPAGGAAVASEIAAVPGLDPQAPAER